MGQVHNRVALALERGDDIDPMEYEHVMGESYEEGLARRTAEYDIGIAAYHESQRPYWEARNKAFALELAAKRARESAYEDTRDAQRELKHREMQAAWEAWAAKEVAK